MDEGNVVKICQAEQEGPTKCPRCGGEATWEIRPRPPGVRMRQIKYIDCPACAAAAKAKEEKYEKAALFAEALDHYYEKLSAANIPPRFADASLESFDMRRASTPAREAAETIHKIRHQLKEGGLTGLLFTGPVGVGKTHLSVAALRIALEGGMWVRYTTSRALCRQVRSAWKKDEDIDPFGGFGRVGLLVIDEVEVAADPKDIAVIDELINIRWNSRVCTALVSNLSPNDLARHIGAPAFDRLAHDGILFEFPDEGESFRTGQSYS